jgi:hypothetical protein
MIEKKKREKKESRITSKKEKLTSLALMSGQPVIVSIVIN